MASVLANMRAKSKRRRELLAQQLGARGPDDLPRILGTEARRDELQAMKLAKQSRATKATDDAAFVVAKAATLDDRGELRKKREAAEGTEEYDGGAFEDYYKVLKEEEEIYKGSATFLKGTQSANPHNDYCQHFVDTGQRPQNFIRDSGLNERFEEYPKLKELIKLKDQLVSDTATPPMYLKADLLTFDLAELGCKFDTIIIEPPLEEYHRHLAMTSDQRRSLGAAAFWSWDMIEQLNVAAVADWRCFVFLWCGGTAEGLDRGRRCLRSWGFRRCEDICWIKTNSKHPERKQNVELAQLFQRTKEHCLMGIRGTVRRSTDGDFIHANVDIDLIIASDPADAADDEYGGSANAAAKPSEIYLIAEHFCLGRRRLHVFGRDDTIRPGWLTVGPELTSSNFDTQIYRSFFEKSPGFTTGCTEKIEQLRPKSPTPRGGGGGGGNAGGMQPQMMLGGEMHQPPPYGMQPLAPPVAMGAGPSMRGGGGRAWQQQHYYDGPQRKGGNAGRRN